jgi:hypothetical protein
MTLHMDVRMNQRGITADLVSLALEYGEWRGDRCRLDRKGLKQLIAGLDRQRAIALRALDKGGLVVVEAGDSQITTYPVSKSKRGSKR